ncbi:hypothetical protein HT576_07670 [Haloterrigena sp. SYSU A121-1]|uniref:Uncharacterized protein n=1 Tax=Haloterrigena gelatinilytica TaxID=2741724 RepID=A0A8J8KFC5_9EURY|nr:hypothetical protein [Haloterrigena gelatinilytica]NUB90897.1 hypothetical protein [Haloterrigena gelatinilytica]
MGTWLRTLTKIHHYHYPVLACVGLIATVVLSSPGTHQYAVGPITVDAFYSSLLTFGALLVLSVTDTYDPEDYGLESDDAER